ncbi:unnamed protein product [Mytilus edulis]|uniref:Uncharacterized protein n=1 Tax=Mytilus edulis TaxID=6550 RepID=A0A8S3TIN8_MYTED|nr:unnamed protein product [Mytilus edulis]
MYAKSILPSIFPLPTTVKRFPYPNDQTLYFEIVVSTLNPYYVAFDSENSHLYWTGRTLGKINRCNPNGSDPTTIVDVSIPVALTLDTHNSTQNSIALHKVTFDGKANQVVVNLTAWPIDIEIDFVDRRIYCMEYDTGDLKSAWYNGSDVKTVVRTNVIGNNREIDIGDDYVFYTSSRNILKIHKSSGQMPTVVHTEPRQIFGLLFYTQEGKL